MLLFTTQDMSSYIRSDRMEGTKLFDFEKERDRRKRGQHN